MARRGISEGDGDRRHALGEVTRRVSKMFLRRIGKSWVEIKRENWKKEGKVDEFICNDLREHHWTENYQRRLRANKSERRPP